MRLSRITIVAAFLLLGGCASMAPEYQRPASPVPAQWPGSPAEGAMSSGPGFDAAELGWREVFADPALQRLITLALDDNRDLRVAILDIERAQAAYNISRTDLFPSVDASAGASAQRTPTSLSGAPEASTSHEYSVGLGFSSYELDFFGRVRSLKDQALETYLASTEARRATQISLVASVASGYLQLVADREQLRLAQETLESQQQSLKLTKSGFEGGVYTDLDLNQARVGVESARFDVARYTSVVAQDINALSLLVGSALTPDLLPAESLADVAALKDIPAGVSSDVLTRRPDILQTEHELKAANANIGAARANFFPRVTLTASTGLASDGLTDLFQAGSNVWSLAPQLSLPIFDAGRNKATLKVSEVDKEILVARYEKAVQTAFKEVADALADRGTLAERLSAQQGLVDAWSASYQLSMARFRGGVDTYLAVLDAQRSLNTAQQQLISTRLSLMTNLLTLYKTLGGGWVENT